MSATDPRLDRVRKLLAKAEDPAVTEAEAELYTKKAAELIARYGIDQAMLADAGGADEITSLKVPIDSPYSQEKAHLLTCVAFPLRCRTLLHRLRPQVIETVTVFGFRSDLGRVELLFTSLLLQASTQLTKVRPEGIFGRESLSAYRRTWLRGFASAVHTRLRATEEAAARSYVPETPGGRSAELVVQDRMALVQRAFEEEFGELRSSAKRRLSGSGYYDGHAAGTRANLDPTALARRMKSLPSLR